MKTCGILAAGCFLCLALALPAAADEPVWPADFDAQVAANLAAAQPGAGQSGSTGDTIASWMRKICAAFSGFVSFNTKDPVATVISFR